MKVLVVQNDFSLLPAADAEDKEPKSYARGQMIKDAAEQNAVIAGGHASRCTFADVADEFFQPDPTPAPAKAAKASA